MARRAEGRSSAPHRVLHLIDTAGPGGAETVFRDLVAHLPKDRWESMAVIPWGDDWLEEALRSDGVRPTILNSGRSFDLGYLRSLARILRDFRPDVIQTHLLTTAVYAGSLARLTGHPVVSTFHGQADAPQTTRLRSLKFHLMNRRSSRFVFVSDALRRWFLETTPLRAERARTVHNGVRLVHAACAERAGLEWRRRLGLAEGDVLIGAVGNLRASKDYGTLLRASRLVIEERPRGVVVVIAGDGTGDAALKNELEVLHAELGLGDHVRFLGFVPDVEQLLAALDVYVLSSSSEGFSISTVEAMACGLPVVATRCGGPEEILREGETGLLVPTEDPEALARSLLRLTQDPAARRRLGDNARTSAEHRFSLHAMVAGYESTYRAVLEPEHAGG